MILYTVYTYNYIIYIYIYISQVFIHLYSKVYFFGSGIYTSRRIGRIGCCDFLFPRHGESGGFDGAEVGSQCLGSWMSSITNLIVCINYLQYQCSNGNG